MASSLEVANPYYESGELLRAKNVAAGGVALSFPSFALSHCNLGNLRRSLDVGCGWGRFAVALRDQASKQNQLYCTDVWPGAVASCRWTLRDADRVHYAVADIRSLPFPKSSFDLVMANHMLYELDDVSNGLREVVRVLRGGGQLLATTYSDGQLVPMTVMHFRTLAAVGHPAPAPTPSSFSLENGEALLGTVFDNVTTYVLVEHQSVTDPQAFRDQYLLTGGYHWASRDESIPGESRALIPEAFLHLASEWITREGSIAWDTSWSAFVACGPRC